MQQFELTHEFLSQLEELIDAGNKTEVSKQIAGLHPADIAEILEELNNERAQFVFLLLDNEKAGKSTFYRIFSGRNYRPSLYRQYGLG